MAREEGLGGEEWNGRIGALSAEAWSECARDKSSSVGVGHSARYMVERGRGAWGIWSSVGWGWGRGRGASLWCRCTPHKAGLQGCFIGLFHKAGSQECAVCDDWVRSCCGIMREPS